VAKVLVALRDVIVRYGDVTAVEIPSLDVHEGELLSLLGVNGAGKSTLLRVMGLLERPTAGSVYFGGEIANGRNAFLLRRGIGNVLQEPLLLMGTVYDNVALGLKLRTTKRVEIKRRVEPWLERLGIAHLASRHVKTLSGGEARRTSLARAFVLAPEVLLLDEPFSALDQPTREGLFRDLETILKETGVTTVLVTHERNEAFTLASRVGILDQGRLLQLGSPLEVFSRPLSEKVAKIVGFENRIRGVVESSSGGMMGVHIGDGCVQVPGNLEAASPVAFCVRAENVSLIPRTRKANTDGDPNLLRVTIKSVVPGLQRDRVDVLCGNLLLSVSLDRKLFPDFRPQKGERALAEIKPDAVHVIRPDAA